MKAQVERGSFGEVGFTITMHQGAVRRIAYQLVEKKASTPNPRTNRPAEVALKGEESVLAQKQSSRKPLIRYEELSEVLGLHRVTLSRYVAARRIPFIKIGGAVRFDLDAVFEALKKEEW